MMTEELLKSGEQESTERLRALGFIDPRGALRNLRLLSAGPFRDSLAEVLSAAALSPSPDGALNNLEAISAGLPEKLIADSLSFRSDTVRRLITVCGSSMYLSNILSQDPGLYRRAFAGDALSESKDFDAFRAEGIQLPVRKPAPDPPAIRIESRDDPPAGPPAPDG